MKNNLIRDLMTVILFFGALALITYGAFLIFRPLAFVVLGAAALYLAACMSRSGD